MRSFVSLFAILLAASASASASSLLTVPLTKLNRTGAYLQGAPDADRTRAASLRSCTGSGPATVPATNVEYQVYLASVGFGDPPTYYNLIVDTGSSNTFCGTGKPYVQTSTSIPTGEAVNVTYGSGNFTGQEYLDRVTIAPNLVIQNQSIGDALSSYGFQGFDGILGLGPPDLTQGSLSSDKNATIPTVMNNLMSQGLIQNQVLGVYYSPSTNYTDINGALTYGGANSSLYEGELMYVPVTATRPATYFWGLNVTCVTYGNNTVISNSTAGMVDSGSTLVLLADDLFSAYMKAIPGATLDSVTGLIEIPPSSVQSMQPLTLFIAEYVFIMDVAAQLIPTNQNTVWGGVAGKQYGVVSNLGRNSGKGLDFVLGMKYLERYYTVFDADANRIGFAPTKNTFTTYQG